MAYYPEQISGRLCALILDRAKERGKIRMWEAGTKSHLIVDAHGTTLRFNNDQIDSFCQGLLTGDPPR